nr:uncharacterized protein LOC120966453 [Aegilops tauschii subsp. strangulata]
MTKWAWKILTGRGGLWLDIFRRKYLEDGGVEFRRNAKLSQFARDVKKVQPLLRLGMKFTDVFPSLFSMAENQTAKVAECWRQGQWFPRFRRPLGQEENPEWEELRDKLRGYSVSLGQDEVAWMRGGD